MTGFGHRHWRQRGFTLIEILVVMVIVSVMAGIVVANMPTIVQSRDFDTESRRLITLLRMAREEAVLQGLEFGLQVHREGYEFLTYDEASQSWSRVTTRPFQGRDLPQGLELSVEVEDAALSFGDEAEDEDNPVPPVLLLSSGEVTPFEVTLAMPDDNLVKRLGSDGYGAIEWRGEDDEAR